MALFISLLSLLSLIFGTDEAEIVFAGDAMMHQAQLEAAKTRDGGYNFSEYFENIKSYVTGVDYAVVNLETPVSAPPYSGYPCFNSPSQYLDALQQAGFNLFLTANNHTLDRGSAGVISTIDALNCRNLEHIGTYRSATERDSVIPFLRNINGIKVGFLNYTYGTNGFTPRDNVVVDYIDRKLIASDINKLRDAGAEFIFVCVHWGVEYQKTPCGAQKELAQFLLTAGADAVIGGHPHVIQPIELTATESPKLIVYSLGNLISNMRTVDTRGGALVKVKLKRNDAGKVIIDDASYRLVFTEPADANHNFRLQWVDSSVDSRAKAFSDSARAIFKKYNNNVREELPDSQILLNFAP